MRTISMSPAAPSRRHWSRSAMSRSFKTDMGFEGCYPQILGSSTSFAAYAHHDVSATDLILRLLLAVGLGAALGLEREYRRKPAGLRTNVLIALGSALFTIMSVQLAHDGGTPDRIAAQIVTGIGFLGGGAILRSRTSVHGMTT